MFFLSDVKLYVFSFIKNFSLCFWRRHCGMWLEKISSELGPKYRSAVNEIAWFNGICGLTSLKGPVVHVERLESAWRNSQDGSAFHNPVTCSEIMAPLVRAIKRSFIAGVRAHNEPVVLVVLWVGEKGASALPPQLATHTGPKTELIVDGSPLPKTVFAWNGDDHKCAGLNVCR